MAQAELGAVLGAFRDLQAIGLFQRGNLDIRAQCGLAHVDRDGAVQVVAAALVEGVFLDLQHDVEIAGRSAVCAGLAFLGEPQAVAVVDARRDVDLEFANHLPVTLPMALPAGIAHDLAAAVAGMAGAPHRQKTLLIEDLAAAVAGGAGGGSAARFGAGGAATVASFHARRLDLGGHAEDRVLETDLQVVAQIFAALRPVAAAAGPAAEQIAESEEIAQNIAEVRERVGVEALRRRILQAGMAVAIVGGALLRVAQDAVGFGGLFELLFGIRVVRVAVRMILQRQLAVGGFHLAVVRVPADAEDFVIVSFRHGKLRGSSGLHGDLHHSRPQKLSFEIISALKFFQNRLVRKFFGLHADDGLMQIRVKQFSGRLDRLQPGFLEGFEEPLIDQFDAFGVFFIGGLHFHGAPEIVKDGNEVADHFRGRILHVLGAVALGPPAEVLEIRERTQQAVLQIGLFRRKLVALAGQRRNLGLGSRDR